MSYQEQALAIIDRLTESKTINIRERGTLRRAILLPERPTVVNENLTTDRPQGEWIEESSETGALGVKYTWVRCN